MRINMSSNKRGRKKGYKCSEETKRKIAASLTGHEVSEEIRRKISKSHKQKGHRPPSRKGVKSSEKHKRNIAVGVSAYHQGCSLDEWDGYVSFEPYCEKFNYMKKEEIRNLYGRVCVVSGVSVLQNGRRLDVDHIDENKMQGCNGIPFRLIPLSRKVHGKMLNKQNHLLLELLLLGNNGAELNYEF